MIRIALLAVLACVSGCGLRRESCWDVPKPIGGSAVAIEPSGSGLIEGVVLSIDGAPIRGALVRVENVGNVTDEKGRFTIDGFRTGVSEVRVRAIGYEMASRPVSLERGKGLRMLAVLESQPVALTDQCGFPMGPVPKPWWKFW